MTSRTRSLSTGATAAGESVPTSSLSCGAAVAGPGERDYSPSRERDHNDAGEVVEAVGGVHSSSSGWTTGFYMYNTTYRTIRSTVPYGHNRGDGDSVPIASML